MPILNRALTRSAPRSAMRLASSWTVIASGTTTSRTCLARRARLHVVALFLLARAAERGKRAGAAVVLVGQSARLTVSLPRWRRSSRGRGSDAPAPGASARARGRGGGSRAPRPPRLGGGGLRFVGAAARGGGERFLLRLAALLRRPLPRPCDSLRRGGALPRWRTLGVFLAAARFLERGHARFLGLAQQLRPAVPCGAVISSCADGLRGGAERRGWLRRAAWALRRPARAWALRAAALRPGGRGCAAS